nr:colicin immunity protein [Escherichia coli]
MHYQLHYFSFFNEDNTENGNKVYRERSLAKSEPPRESWRLNFLRKR